jgi:hypothetical protein
VRHCWQAEAEGEGEGEGEGEEEEAEASQRRHKMERIFPTPYFHSLSHTRTHSPSVERKGLGI